MRIAAALAAAVAAAMPLLRPTRIRRPRLGGIRVVAAGLACAALAAAALHASGLPLAVAAAGGSFAFPVPGLVRHAARRREAGRLAARWPDFLGAVRSRVAGGSPLPDAVRAAGRHIGGRFAELDVGMGAGFAAHMAQMRARWGDTVADRVFITLDAAAASGGGHVDAILRQLADSIAGELRLRRAHDAALTQQRLTAAVALLAPWVLLALSLATNPTAAQAYSTPAGSIIVLGGLAATLVGYVLASRTARLAHAPRLFR